MSGVISHRRRSKSSHRCRKPPTRFFLTAQMRSERASRERANFSESWTYISMTCAMMAFRDCSRRALASLRWQACPVTGHGRASSVIPIFAKLETNILVGNGSPSSRAEMVMELRLKGLDSKADSSNGHGLGGRKPDILFCMSRPRPLEKQRPEVVAKTSCIACRMKAEVTGSNPVGRSPRSMKMGTRSAFLYDAAASYACQSAKLRHPSEATAAGHPKLSPTGHRNCRFTPTRRSDECLIALSLS